MTQEELVKQIIARNERLKNDRNPWITLWEEAMNFVCPQHGTLKSFYSTASAGEKRGAAVYDGTPESAKDVMVSGLYSGMTPDGYKWFRWNVLPIELGKHPEARRWLEQCEDITYQALNDSNYSDITLMAHEYQICFGTQIKYCEEDIAKTLSFANVPLQDCVFSENHVGVVDTVFREFRLSARNVVRRWGLDEAPNVVKTAMENHRQDEEFDFLHAVYPREDYAPYKRDKENMPFVSLWIYTGSEKKVMAEGGYRTFPYSVSRMYKMPRENYGRGPAIKALQTMGVLNAMALTNLVAGERMVEPAMQVPDGYDRVLDLSPGGVNYYSAQRGEIKPIVTGMNVPFGLDLQDRCEKAVQRWFHVDVFLALSMSADHQRTLGEVLELKQEKMLLLGPQIGRQKREHIDSDLDRVFSILFDNGYFPRPPDVIVDYMQEMQTEYTSPLFLAQRRRDSDAAISVYQKAALIAQSTQRPDVLDVLDDEAAIRLIADREVTPSEIIRSPEMVARLRAERAKKMQEAQQIQAGMAAVEAAKSLGQTPIDPNNPTALTRAAEAMGG